MPAKNFYIQSIQVLRANWALAGLTAIALALVNLAYDMLDPEATSRGGTSGFVLSAIAYAACMYVLRGRSMLGFFQENPKDKTFQGFLFRYIMFGFIWVLPFMFYGWLISPTGPTATRLDIIALLFAGLLSFLVGHGLFGTWPPAAVTDRDKSFIAATKRGLRNFWYVISRILIGPALLFLLNLVLAILAAHYFGLTGANYSASTGLSFRDLLVEIPLQFVNVCIVAMLYVILSRALLRDEARHQS